MLIGLSMFLWVPMFAQTADSIKKQNAPDKVEGKDSTLLVMLKNTRIVFKDGSIRKNCKVKEINDYWIVYEKDGSMHDQTIEKIRRIEIGDGTRHAVFFDEKNKPVIRIYVH